MRESLNHTAIYSETLRSQLHCIQKRNIDINNAQWKDWSFSQRHFCWTSNVKWMKVEHYWCVHGGKHKSSNSSQNACQGDMTHSEQTRHVSCSSMKHYDWLSGRAMKFMCVRGNHCPMALKSRCFYIEINIHPEIQKLLRFVGNA